MTRQAHFVEMEEEEMILMAYLEEMKENDVWFLDSGCSNHSCGDISLFTCLEEGYQRKVRLGNHTQMEVKGKDSVRLFFEGISYLVNDVFYVPDLRNNLLSLGQLQEKGLAVLIKENQCHMNRPTKGLIVQCNMTSNQIFMLMSTREQYKQVIKDVCFQTNTQESAQLWHRMYDHLSYSGLNTLQNKGMVRRLPNLGEAETVCTKCLKGKQQENVFQRIVLGEQLQN